MKTARAYSDVHAFVGEVYDVVAQIPPGRVMSYGQIAQLICRPDHARQVGNALKAAPAHMHLPCHRVVGSTGRTAPGWFEQRELLEREGIVFKKNGCVDISRFRWKVDD